LIEKNIAGEPESIAAQQETIYEMIMRAIEKKNSNDNYGTEYQNQRPSHSIKGKNDSIF